MHKIIGFSGKACAGKDTAAGMLPLTFECYAFATPLKEAARGLFGLTDRQLHINKDDVIERLGLSPRQIFKRLGDAVRAEFGADIFVKIMRDNLESEEGDAVITDVHFPEEVELIHSLGGIVVEIRRDGIADVAAHRLEVGVLADYWVDNNGVVAELRSMVEWVLDKEFK